MLRQFGPSTWLALGLGAVLAFFAFVPLVWWRYRKTGRLRLVDLIGLVLVTSYAMALWTYTLIPVPENDTFACARVNLVPFQFVADIAADPHTLLKNKAILQAALNVAFFMPLGFLLRAIWNRRVLWATGAGLLISLSIEFTQLSGVWGIFHCAYRVFDVDDLLLNTTGAALGSLLAIPVLRMLRSDRPTPRVTEVTLGRRLTGMVVDVIAISTASLFVSIAAWAAGNYLLRLSATQLDAVADWSYLIPAAVQGWWVIGRGRTFGEEAVQLEPVAQRPAVIRDRIVKFISGVGGYLLLSSALNPIGWLLPVFVLITGLATLRSQSHRGLSHTLAGMDLRVAAPGPGRPGSS